MRKIMNSLIISIFAMFLTSCASTTVHQSSQLIVPAAGAKWGIAPFDNHTQTPQVGEKVVAMTATFLHAKGVHHIMIYHQKNSEQALLTGMTQSMSEEEMLKWAKANRITYVMTGDVNEWRYKVGLDGEPVVSASFTLYDVKKGEVIWSIVGSKTGGSRSGLSEAGQSLIAGMLSKLAVS